MANIFDKDHQVFIELLNRHNVEYLLMGVNEITMFSLGARDEPGHIELTNRIAGIKFEEAYPQAIVNQIEGLTIRYLHFNDLIKNKLASGRPRDMDDVENLKSIKNKQEKKNLRLKQKEATNIGECSGNVSQTRLFSFTI